jgi:hypothetical protein
MMSAAQIAVSLFNAGFLKVSMLAAQKAGFSKEVAIKDAREVTKQYPSSFN